MKPHRIRYYLERRDPEFEEKMAHVLCIYREIEILKEANVPSDAVAIISYDVYKFLFDLTDGIGWPFFGHGAAG